jgi:hypothetical protein
MALVRGATSEWCSSYHRSREVRSAAPAAQGDLLAALLALSCIGALRARWAIAIALVWIFNVVGVLDLINGLFQGNRLGVELGAAHFIRTVAVPAPLVTHAMIFSTLIRGRQRATVR